ncbi:response regulator [Mycobacterium ulcerans]|uniref:Adenylylate/guanylate cyclase n=2 Tax=Mycobacterium ulcerans TaxID=1809 RepID=A0PTR6_MYCUA|nr:adenylate/guanylate cyclase domain-containing response regulator [Mycobacterium ulcerans]ABL05735.1 adenylylate/guanylate cyclase [Mycobacterium ulcerans Agy99]MEB3906503.1 response regulator [Mycobacterium ulcerans]MEB3910666.1 response regulator [Mycobacterium ulcerans]MEB3920917.1 response regulator [Mycobacterium ulcerans]MEB3925023.1 response regulator [Mycobacterium ulcerans]
MHVNGFGGLAAQQVAASPICCAPLDERSAIPGPQPPVRLLVVDDADGVETLFGARFRTELRCDEYDLSFSNDPVQALKMVGDSPDIEVLVTNLNMPQMNGLDLLTEVAKLGRPLKTIVLTACNDLANIRAAMMRGAFDFQLTPLDLEDLRVTISKAVTIVRELQAGEAARQRALELADQNRRVENIFGRYVSEEVKTHLLACPEGHQNSERRTLTMLMADIRGFTRLSEILSPERALQVLNAYLERATDVVIRWNGTINEILGDGLLVFFGVPNTDGEAAEHAVAAALELQLAMGELNVSHREQGLPELGIGIGVHTGEAVVGTIGSPRRQKYTAIGKNVNLVARIESNTVGGQVLVSESTYHEICAIADTSGSTQVRVKGLTEPITVHDITGLAGRYNLRLPSIDRKVIPLVVPRPTGIAVIENKIIGAAHPAEVVGSGDGAVRVRTGLQVAPFCDLVLDVAGAQVFAKVVDCGVDGGICELMAVFTSVSDDVRRALAAPSTANSLS